MQCDIDSQGGLRIYGVALILFWKNMTSMTLIAEFLAVEFVESYQACKQNRARSTEWAYGVMLRWLLLVHFEDIEVKRLLVNESNSKYATLLDWWYFVLDFW